MSFHNTIYIVVEKTSEYSLVETIIGACWSKSEASKLCLDPTKNRRVKSVPILDDYVKPTFEPRIDPIDPIYPSSNPLFSSPVEPIDPFAKPHDMFGDSNIFIPKK